MLFFFELLLFLLILLTLGLAEFVSRGLALGVWLACTAASLVGYVLARRSLHDGPQLPASTRGAGPHPLTPSPARGGGTRGGRISPPRRGEGAGVGSSAEEGAGEGPARAPKRGEQAPELDERWARTLLYTWRRTNALLLFGALVVSGWYWLGIALP